MKKLSKIVALPKNPGKKQAHLPLTNPAALL